MWVLAYRTHIPESLVHHKNNIVVLKALCHAYFSQVTDTEEDDMVEDAEEHIAPEYVPTKRRIISSSRGEVDVGIVESINIVQNKSSNKVQIDQPRNI